MPGSASRPLPAQVRCHSASDLSALPNAPCPPNHMLRLLQKNKPKPNCERTAALPRGSRPPCLPYQAGRPTLHGGSPHARRIIVVALTAPTSMALACPVEEPSTASEPEVTGVIRSPRQRVRAASPER